MKTSYVTEENCFGRLLVQVDKARARQVSKQIDGKPWLEHQLPGLVVLRADLAGFCDYVARNRKGAIKLLRNAVNTVRLCAIRQKGVFESHYGDRTTSIFGAGAVLPNDTMQADPWVHAIACALELSIGFEKLIKRIPPQDREFVPQIRFGIVGGSENTVMRSVNLCPNLPPEMRSFCYDLRGTSSHCVHSLADSLCELATTENLTDMHLRLPGSQKNAFWHKTTLRRAASAIAMVDVASMSDADFTKINVALARYNQSFELFRLPYRLGDARHGQRDVALAIARHPSPLPEASVKNG